MRLRYRFFVEKWSGLVVVLVWFLLLCIPCGDAVAPRGHPKVTKTMSVEKSLVRMLLNRYEQYGVIGRPVNDSKIQAWYDPLLRWNESEYKDIRTVRIFPSQIWTPDIKLYNFADERLKEHREARVVIYSDGTTLWVPQALFKSTCEVEITYFPFDTQICMLEFGSWAYDETQMDIVWWLPDGRGTEPMPYLDFSDYVPSNEWRTDGEMERNNHHTNRTIQIRSVKKYRYRNITVGNEVISRKYPVLRYLIRLRRNPSFYVFMLVIPCVLLSSLTLVVFWLPPESPAKMMLGMNIFVAFFVLLLLLAESTPSAVKNFPLIGVYFCLNMIMITLSTFLATLVIHLYFRGDRNGSVPRFLRRFVIEGIGRLIFVRQRIPLPDASTNKNNKIDNNDDDNNDKSNSVTADSNGRRQFPTSVGNKQFMNEALQYSHGHPHPLHPHPHHHHHHHHPDGAVPYGWNLHSQPPPPLPPQSAQPVGLINSAGYPMFDTRGGGSGKKSDRSKPSGYFPQYYGYPDPAYCGSGPYINECDPNVRMPSLDQLLYAKQLVDSNGITDNANKTESGPEGIDGSPDLLTSTVTLERDVREVKRYVKLFVNRQKEIHRRSLIAMEWRTLALVLDRLFFFLYITTIGIAVLVSVPRSTEPEVPDAFREI